MPLYLSFLLALSVPLLASAEIVTQTGDSTTAAPSPLPVTVTQAMGDVGGKFFGQTPDPAKTRHYYIAAEPELWNFVPDGQDSVCGKTFPLPLLLNRVSWKIRYAQYADPQFSARVLPAPRLGILGPVLRGTTGEYLAVTVLNRSWRPISMHPHGLRYDKDSEGSFYKPNPGLGASIAPGAKFTYIWHLDEAAGPRPDEPSSKAWLYHSHVGGEEDINLGLFGFIVVTDPARARPDGTPKDVDREMAALFNIFNETPSGAADEDEPEEHPAGPVQPTWAETQQYAEQGERHTINGRTFGNLAGLEMNEGEHVRWYLFGLGSEKDFHTAHWHGQRVVEDGRKGTDVIELLPASMKVADMRADNPGSWLLHCHVADHMEQGMYARFMVHPAHSTGVSREPEAAFFGTAEAAQTLGFQSAELGISPDTCELDLSGKVTVPNPYSIARQPFAVKIGERKFEFWPDASGVCVTNDGMLLIKNASPYGNGAVTGGTLNFDVALKGAAVRKELESAHVIEHGALASHATLHVDLTVGPAHHSGATGLQLLPP